MSSNIATLIILLLIALVSSFVPQQRHHRSLFVGVRKTTAATVLGKKIQSNDDTWKNPANLPKSEAVRKAIDNEELFQAVMDFGYGYSNIAKRKYAYKKDDSSPPIKFPDGKRYEVEEERQKFLSKYPERGSGKDQLEYLIGSLDEKRKDILVELSGKEYSDPVKASELKRSLETTVADQLSSVQFLRDKEQSFGPTINLCRPGGPRADDRNLRRFFDSFVAPNYMTKTDLKKALHLTLQGLPDQTSTDNELPPPYFGKYESGLVLTSDPNPDQHLLNDPEKDSVLVVAGETGSGKTFFSGYGVHASVPRLYLKVAQSDVNDTRFEDTPEDKDAKDKWSDYFQRGVSRLKRNRRYRSLCLAFNTARLKVRQSRNDWAWSVVTKMIEKLESGNLESENLESEDLESDDLESEDQESEDLESEEDMESEDMEFEDMDSEDMDSEDMDYGDVKVVSLARWFAGKQEAAPLDRFLLVVDEVGRSLDLAHGLVDIGLRRLQVALVNSGRAKQVGLVLCGTSLDQLRPSEEGPIIGSDPDKGQVIIMQGTNLDRLEQLLWLKKDGRIQLETLKKGFYSKIYATNIRILNRALLPFLRSIYAAHEDDQQDRNATQERLCNFWASMLFVPSIFYRLNGLRAMAKTAMRRLFQCAFAFFLRQGTKGIPRQEHPRSVELCLQLEEDPQIFQRGIATYSPDETSEALKFISARGFAAPVATSSGLMWEEFVKLHLQRLLECKGIPVRQIELQAAWPPAGTGPWADPLSDEHREDASAIASVIEAGEGAVLTNDRDTAQSADVIVLIPYGRNVGKNGRPSNYGWELHQSKNCAKWPTASESFPSLGVDPSDFLRKGKNETDIEFQNRKVEVSAKANRSRQGFRKLIGAVQNELAQTEAAKTRLSNVQRVVDIALPRDTRKGKAFRKQAKEVKICVMTKEFFEPTISACHKVLNLEKKKRTRKKNTSKKKKTKDEEDK